MADLKPTEPVAVAAKTEKALQYCGPQPAPLIGNLPSDLNDLRLGISVNKYPADELPAHYIPYVMASNTLAKNWWK